MHYFVGSSHAVASDRPDDTKDFISQHFRHYVLADRKTGRACVRWVNSKRGSNLLRIRGGSSNYNLTRGLGVVYFQNDLCRLQITTIYSR